MTEHVQLTDTSRLAYEQDSAPEDPRSWVPEVDCLVYNTSYRGVTDHLGDCQTRLGTVFTIVWGKTGDDDLALRVARRYAQVFGVDEQIDTYSATGYSQGDWWDVVAAVPQGFGTPESHAKTFEMWARGDVMCVALERKVEWVEVQHEGLGAPNEADGQPRTQSTWESEDSICGVYVDGDEQVKQAALEHFELTPEEQEACAA